MKHLQFLQEINSLKGKVVLSGYDHDLYDSELKGWKKLTKEASTNGAEKRIEVLWIK